MSDILSVDPEFIFRKSGFLGDPFSASSFILAFPAARYVSECLTSKRQTKMNCRKNNISIFVCLLVSLFLSPSVSPENGQVLLFCLVFLFDPLLSSFINRLL